MPSDKDFKRFKKAVADWTDVATKILVHMTRLSPHLSGELQDLATKLKEYDEDIYTEAQ